MRSSLILALQRWEENFIKHLTISVVCTLLLGGISLLVRKITNSYAFFMALLSPGCLFAEFVKINDLGNGIISAFAVSFLFWTALFYGLVQLIVRMKWLLNILRKNN